jgi:serine protease AprX
MIDLSALLKSTALAFAPLLLTSAVHSQQQDPAWIELYKSARPDVTETSLRILLARGAEELEHKAWVWFTDKGPLQASELEQALAEASQVLDEHSSQRRARSMGGARVDFHDLGVRPDYRAAVAALGVDVCNESRWLNAISVRTTVKKLERIARLPGVRGITPVGTQQNSSAPPAAAAANTPPVHHGDRFDYGSSRGQLEEIGVLAAHNAGFSGAGVLIAMLDTGFDWDQPVFKHIVDSGRLIAQKDFVHSDVETHDEPGDTPGEHTHGTFTWSTVGGLTPGELVGPAYGSSFLLAKTEDINSETIVEEDNWIAAAEWADSLGADVISSSLIYIDWYLYSDMDGLTAPITLAADIAVGRGIVVCNAAGNSGTSNWFYIGAPADGFGVISVGASRSDGSMAGFSSHGPTYDGRTKPDVVARGDATYCAAPAGWDPAYLFVSGTSLACPLVAGAAALLLEAHPTWNPAAVRAALRSTADQSASPDNHRGWGRIDVMAAILLP